MNSFDDWTEAAATLKKRGESFVMVTVLTVRGSAPRDAGTKMLVTADRIVGTIGGGHLEYLATGKARELLASGEECQRMEDIPLGAKLGQCCGGHVSLLFETFVSRHPTVAVFGAGHVGRELVTILSRLPLRVTWLDGRAEEFPTPMPEGVNRVLSNDLVDEVTDLEPGSLVVILTHLHPLDYALAEAVLKRGDAAWVGVIGSQTKAARFRMRLEHRGFSPEQIAQLRCPMGLSTVPGKHPMEVAVSVAGELIARYQALMPRRQPALPHSHPVPALIPSKGESL